MMDPVAFETGFFHLALVFILVSKHSRFRPHTARLLIVTVPAGLPMVCRFCCLASSVLGSEAQDSKEFQATLESVHSSRLTPDSET